MNKIKQKVSKAQQDGKEFGYSSQVLRFLQPTKRKAGLSLVLALALTLCFAWFTPRIAFDYRFDSFFPQADEELAFYERLNDAFGQYNDFLYLVIKSNHVLKASFQQELNALATRLTSHPEIHRVATAYDLRNIQITPFGLNNPSLLPIDTDLNISSLKEKNLWGQFFGTDSISTLLLIDHQFFENKQKADIFYEHLEDEVKNAGFSDFLLSGKVQMQYSFTRKLEQELSLSLVVSIVVIIVLLYLFFRSIKGIGLPLLTLSITLIWVLGFMGMTGKNIDVMMVMMPALLLIVALSDIIHLIHAYDDNLENGLNTTIAIQLAVAKIGKATLLTSVTTAIGFLSLYFIPVSPIQQFGLYTAIAVLFAFIVTFMIVPAWLFFFPSAVAKKIKYKPILENRWVQLSKWLKNHPRKIVYTTLLFVLIVGAGVHNVRSNTGIIVGLQRNEPELKTVDYFDEHYGGYKPFEVGIALEENTQVTDHEVLKKIQAIEDYLTQYFQVQHIQSPLQLVKQIRSGLYGGSSRQRRFPSQEEMPRIDKYYYAPALAEARKVVQAEEGQLVRILGRAQDLGSAHYRPINASFQTFLEELNTNGFRASLTGTTYLIEKTDLYIVEALVKGLTIALLSVWLCLWFFLKDVKIAIWATIVNVIPIVIMFGLMGWLQIDLNISTAVVFTVAFGIAVDDSIHFVSRYLMEGKNITKTLRTTGKSILATTLVIVMGFSIFLFSQFSATYFLGLFITISALVALVVDLILLPVLLKFGTKVDG